MREHHITPSSRVSRTTSKAVRRWLLLLKPKGVTIDIPQVTVEGSCFSQQLLTNLDYLS